MDRKRIKLNDDRIDRILREANTWPTLHTLRDLLIQLMSLRVTAKTYDDEADYQKQINLLIPVYEEFIPNGEPRLYADFLGMITNQQNSEMRVPQPNYIYTILERYYEELKPFNNELLDFQLEALALKDDSIELDVEYTETYGVIPHKYGVKKKHPRSLEGVDKDSGKMLLDFLDWYDKDWEDHVRRNHLYFA